MTFDLCALNTYIRYMSREFKSRVYSYTQISTLFNAEESLFAANRVRVSRKSLWPTANRLRAAALFE